jgi:tetratricopeptide (TPR) repeat protein
MRFKLMLVGLLVLFAHGVRAEKKAVVDSIAEAPTVVDTAAHTPAAADTALVAASDLWLNTAWKRVEQLTAKQRAFEVERATTVAGVRGKEAEDEIVNRLYFKGGTRYPARLEVERAIRLLNKRIAAAPKSKDVPEIQYFMAQCSLQLGEEENALALCRDLVKQHGKSEWAKKAEEEIKRLEKTEKGK